MSLTFTKETKVVQESKDVDELIEVIFALHMPRLIIDGVVQRGGDGKTLYDVGNISARMRYIGIDTDDDSVLEDDSLVATFIGQPVLDYFTNNPSEWQALKSIFEKMGKASGVVPNSAVSE